MELSSLNPDRLESPSTRAVPALPGLDVAYAEVPVASALAAPGVIAVIGFGDSPATTDDPRRLQVGLEPLDGFAPLEIWRVQGVIESGRDGPLRWASDGTYSFVAVELDEADHGGVADSTRHAYALLSAWRRRSPTPHWLRMWNYLDAINQGEGDAERYRQFCSGRAAGLTLPAAAGYPAATAIGLHRPRGRLLVYALASNRPGRPVENPRQLNAWRYPRRYGPTAPSFARAMRAPDERAQLYISGTAAIVGHASRHPGDLDSQLAETLANLDSLIRAAGHRAALDAHHGVLKVYLRRAADAVQVRQLLRQRFGADMPLLLLHGDVCRAELLVEIDGLHND